MLSETCSKRVFCSTFPMFVPSLSWQIFEFYDKNWRQKRRFPFLPVSAADRQPQPRRGCLTEWIVGNDRDSVDACMRKCRHVHCEFSFCVCPEPVLAKHRVSQGRKNGFEDSCSPLFILKQSLLPRRARDKHRENRKQNGMLAPVVAAQIVMFRQFPCLRKRF